MHTLSCGLHSFAFPPAHVLQPLSLRKTSRKSAYPLHYSAAFAFSGFFCPHRCQPSFRSALPPERRRDGVTVFRVFDTTGQVPTIPRRLCVRVFPYGRGT